MVTEATFVCSCLSLLEVEMKGNRDSETMLKEKKKDWQGEKSRA